MPNRPAGVGDGGRRPDSVVLLAEACWPLSGGDLGCAEIRATILRTLCGEKGLGHAAYKPRNPRKGCGEYA